jgi:glycosyltransferase involved in cell wall biosynthesis
MPAVSVVMPCYNAGKFVRQSVESILRQTLDDFELLVVDDASRDNSVEVLKDLADRDARIKLLAHGKNLGVSRSRNDGLREAQGDYIAFCDADDVWKPEKLKMQIGFLLNNPAYNIAYCDAQIIDETGTPTGRLFSDQYPPPKKPSGDLFEALCVKNFINMQTVCMRRMAAGQDLFFDEGIKWVEDWWYWIRLSRRHRFLYEGRALAEYRIHPQSTGLTQQRGIRINRWKVCKRNLRAHTDMPIRLQALLW